MALLDGGLARLFGAALGGVYRPATLHRIGRERLRGGSLAETVADLPCRAQLDAAVEGGGEDGGEVRILLLAASLAGGVAAEDRLTLAGTSYVIGAVERDPAGAIWQLRCRRG